ACDLQAEDLDGVRADDPGVARLGYRVLPRGVGARDPALSDGGLTQRVPHAPAGDLVEHLAAVARGVDAGRARPLPLVRADGAARADLYPGRDRQRHLWAHADSDRDHVRLQNATRV